MWGGCCGGVHQQMKEEALQNKTATKREVTTGTVTIKKTVKQKQLQQKRTKTVQGKKHTIPCTVKSGWRASHQNQTMP